MVSNQMWLEQSENSKLFLIKMLHRKNCERLKNNYVWSNRFSLFSFYNSEKKVIVEI